MVLKLWQKFKQDVNVIFFYDIYSKSEFDFCLLYREFFICTRGFKAKLFTIMYVVYEIAKHFLMSPEIVNFLKVTFTTSAERYTVLAILYYSLKCIQFYNAFDIVAQDVILKLYNPYKCPCSQLKLKSTLGRYLQIPKSVIMYEQVWSNR